jgi:lysophospholipase L1-like esterase
MKDNTHLSPLGAEEVSELVAEEIKKIDIDLKQFIK